MTTDSGEVNLPAEPGSAALTTEGEAPQVPPASTPARHIDAIDVVRPVGALLVIVSHTVEALAPATLHSMLLLGFLHSSRNIFFITSGLVLTYSYYDRSQWSVGRFWWRRTRLIIIPYLIWTVVYFAISQAGVHGLSMTRIARDASVERRLIILGQLIVEGTGHLYPIVVLVQFYILFPVFIWILQRTRRVHLLLLGGAAWLQVWLLDKDLHGTLPYIMQSALGGRGLNREIPIDVIYLVGGALIGVYLRPFAAILWRFRWLGLLLCSAVILGVLGDAYSLTTHGVSPASASYVYRPIYIPLFFAVFVFVFIVGLFWSKRCSGSWMSGVVRSASDNSFGVYLMHPIILDLIVQFGFEGVRGYRWEIIVPVVVVAVYATASLITSLLARLPLSLATVGRQRMALTGGTPSGRGSHRDAAGRYEAAHDSTETSQPGPLAQLAQPLADGDSTGDL